MQNTTKQHSKRTIKSILKIKAAHNHMAMKMKSGILKNLFFGFVTSLCLLAQLNFAFGQTAGILAQAVTQFFDNNGNPLSLGKVYTYVAGTSTPKTTWLDPLEVNPNTNPINLDIAGRAIIYGNGTYTETVLDKNNNLIWTGLTQPVGVTVNQTLIGDGQPVGTVKPWAAFIAPAQYAFAYGQTISRTTYPDLLTAITIATTGACSSGNNTITGISDTSQIPIGAPLETVCVTAATTVVSKTSSTITMSNPSLTSLNATVTFFPWGNGDGSTTFNVPDLRGVVLAGRPNMGGVDNGKLTSTYYGANPDAQASYGGSQSTTLVAGNLPSITPTFTGTPATLTTDQTGIITNWGGSQASASAGSGAVNASGLSHTTATITGFTPAGTISNNGGTSTAFSQIQPSVTINYIIKITADINASTANGVASIGGMVGVIACGNGITCAGNTISTNISNIDGSLTIGTTGSSTIASINTAHSNAFSVAQTIPTINSPAATNLGLNASTGQAIAFQINSTSLMQMQSGLFVPNIDNTITLGSSSNRWSSVYSPIIYGSGATNGTLTLQSTNSGSPSGDSISLLVGQGSGQINLGLFGGGGTVNLNVGKAGAYGGQLVIASPTANAMTFVPAASATGIATLPSGTYNIVGDVVAEAMTNKTLTSSTNVVGGVTMTLGSDATGDMYYRNSSGILTRLPVCTGTNVIGASGGIPACVTQGGTGAAQTYLCTITASNSASINNASPTSGSCPINSSYTSYRLVFQNLVPATNEKIMELQVHSGGAYKATGYLTNENILINGATAGSIAVTTYIPITFPSDANGDAIANTVPGLSGEVFITNPSVSGLIMVNGNGAYLDGSGNVATETISGYWNTAGVVDGFQVLMDSGNLTSGSILVYGIQ